LRRVFSCAELVEACAVT